VPESYQFNFVCKGKDAYTVDWTIDKEEKGKGEYRGKYFIYSLEDYSLNDYETEEAGVPEETYKWIYCWKKKASFLNIRYYFYNYYILGYCLLYKL